MQTAKVFRMRHACCAIAVLVLRLARLLDSSDGSCGCGAVCASRAMAFGSAALFVFAGQTCSVEHHGASLEQTARQVRAAAAESGVVLVETHLCFAPESTQRIWARYSPTASEVEAHGGSWWAAERSTCSVPALAADLSASCGEAWALMEDAARRVGRVLLVGFSNGAIPATEFATTHPDKVLALLLLSGIPAAAQQRWVLDGHKSCPPVSLTLGSRESYFGGRPAFHTVALAFRAPVFDFEGGHCGENDAVVSLATRDALKRAFPC